MRDAAVHEEVIVSVLNAAGELGYALRELTFSPITGGEGNIEFLAYWEWLGGQQTVPLDEAAVKAVVKAANATFKV
ncbi:hypothetical protein D3C86_2143130 [compost metagenome]